MRPELRSVNARAVSLSGRERMHFRVLKQAGIAAIVWALAVSSWTRAQQAQPIAGGNPALPLVHVETARNSAAAQSAHYVVLVSLDGFRWDYAKRDRAE